MNTPAFSQRQRLTLVASVVGLLAIKATMKTSVTEGTSHDANPDVSKRLLSRTLMEETDDACRHMASLKRDEWQRRLMLNWTKTVTMLPQKATLYSGLWYLPPRYTTKKSTVPTMEVMVKYIPISVQNRRRPSRGVLLAIE